MNKPRVLICDDEEGIRESLKLILEKDYETVFAKSGIEALDKIKEKDIGVVLLDIKMPKVSGLDILKEIKAIKPELVVIVVTGYQSVEMASQALKNGALEYIVKPFDKNQVLDAVKKAIKD